MEKFGYQLLNGPLQALNIIFPHDNFSPFDPEEKDGEEAKVVDVTEVRSTELIGLEGLKRIMSFDPKGSHVFEYKNADDKRGRIFSSSEIGRYSGKIKRICEKIVESTGVILIYSTYIYGGLIPLALALEELGFTRAGTGKSLFKEKPENKNNEPFDLSVYDKNRILFLPYSTQKTNDETAPALLPIDNDLHNVKADALKCCASYIEEEFEDYDVNFSSKISVVPVEILEINDFVRVFPGDVIPTDGIVFIGKGLCNESMLSGEEMRI
jgi:hypothetical protein